MSLFPDMQTAVATFCRDRIAGTPLAGQTLDEDFLAAQLRAATVDAGLALRVFLEPTLVLPESASQAERDALDEDGTPWVEEPGYDLEGDFFSGERWGYLVTRHRPIVAVHSMQFVYPQPYSGVFTVPADWIRTDKKYGHIRLVPGTQAFAAPLSAWVMQVMGAGRTVPQMIQLRYTAGLRNAAQQYPELVDLVQRMAALRMLQGQFVGASSSISADGLSESRSLDLDKFQGDIDHHLERLRQVIHGVQCLVF